MQGKEIAYCNTGIRAIAAAILSVLDASVQEALSKVPYGKGDTLGLDALPEISILNVVGSFDKRTVVITEETDDITAPRWNDSSNPEHQHSMMFSDPTDRSKFFRFFLEQLANGDVDKKIGELLEEKNAQKFWENLKWEKSYNEKPAAITGATSAITCIYQGSVIFSVIGNYITRKIYVACQAGLLEYSLPCYANRGQFEKIDLSQIIADRKRITFPQASSICANADDYRIFTTFLGKEGYAENLQEAKIFCSDVSTFLHHKEPGGPSRVLYLSNLQQGYGPIGFVLANGEKIGEWIHWLPFVKWARDDYGNPALKLFEISTASARFNNNGQYCSL